MNVRAVYVTFVGIAALCLCPPTWTGNAHLNLVTAQANSPVLISEESSTRGIAFDSVTHQREPFSAIATIGFGSDHRTRIMLFAMNLDLKAGEGPNSLTADAEDASHQNYPLTIEYVGPVPEAPWATSVVICLDDQ